MVKKIYRALPESENLSYFQRPDRFAFSSHSVMPCQSFVKQYKTDSNESFEKPVSVGLGRVQIQIQNLLIPNLLRCWRKKTNRPSSKIFIWCLDKTLHGSATHTHTHTFVPCGLLPQYAGDVWGPCLFNVSSSSLEDVGLVLWCSSAKPDLKAQPVLPWRLRHPHISSL